MRHNIKELHDRIKTGNFSALARGITLLENELQGSRELLLQLRHNSHVPVAGITGPPGAGKSTLVNALAEQWLLMGKKIAIIAVDPSSPFNYGALLGDRIRMAGLYNNPNVYIRSLASRGALGGLNRKIIDITELVKQAPFDIILVETVGVGQSEVEIAGLADITIVALVPEAGDEVQTLKAGIMEIADIFVVNKADRDNAEALYRSLRIMAHEKAGHGAEIPVFKTIATENTGIKELAEAILNYHPAHTGKTEKQLQLISEKSWQLMQAAAMKHIDFTRMKQALAVAITQPDFNLYGFAMGYYTESISNDNST